MAKFFITCMNHMFDINQIGNLAWIPLHSFIKSPQFEGKLKIRGFLSSFLHCSKPGAVYVKSSLHHFKLIQACFINILLLHYVQLWMQQTQNMMNNVWHEDPTDHVISPDICRVTKVYDPCQQNTQWWN